MVPPFLVSRRVPSVPSNILMLPQNPVIACDARRNDIHVDIPCVGCNGGNRRPEAAVGGVAGAAMRVFQGKSSMAVGALFVGFVGWSLYAAVWKGAATLTPQKAVGLVTPDALK